MGTGKAYQPAARPASKPLAQTSALDFEEQNFFTIGNDDSDVASLSVGGNLLKTDSGFAGGWGGNSAAGKSAMSHTNPAN